MADLSKLGIGLTVVFVLSLTAFLAELCYIFFRRRRQSLGNSSSCVFCCGEKSGVEMTGAPTTIHPVDDDNVVEQQDELAKWQAMYGPSRVLFTIKEEEKEDLESEKSCSERKSQKRSVSGLVEELEKEETDVVVVLVETEPVPEPETETPFYTPSSSPPRDAEWGGGNLKESERWFVVEIDELRRQPEKEKEKEKVFSGSLT